jgi:hypothetical protein
LAEAHLCPYQEIPLRRKPDATVISHIICFVAAFGAATFIYWLASELRPDGIPGALQVWLQFTVIIPPIVGAVFALNPHNPSSLAGFIALFVQFYAISILVRFVVLKKGGAVQRA